MDFSDFVCTCQEYLFLLRRTLFCFVKRGMRNSMQRSVFLSYALYSVGDLRVSPRNISELLSGAQKTLLHQ